MADTFYIRCFSCGFRHDTSLELTCAIRIAETHNMKDINCAAQVSTFDPLGQPGYGVLPESGYPWKS